MTMNGRALITGVTGQDGSYLAEFLLEKGYEVHGMVRRSSTETFERIAHLEDRIHLQQADLLDQFSLVNMLREVRPSEVYNLAAQSFVPTSWNQPGDEAWVKADDAWYVQGSKRTGGMGAAEWVPFSEKLKAEEFMTEFGLYERIFSMRNLSISFMQPSKDSPEATVRGSVTLVAYQYKG